MTSDPIGKTVRALSLQKVSSSSFEDHGSRDTFEDGESSKFEADFAHENMGQRRFFVLALLSNL